MKFIVFLLLCSMVGAFARPNEDSSETAIQAFADPPLLEKDGRSKRSSDSSSEKISQEGNQSLSKINDLLQQILSGNVSTEEIFHLLSVGNIKSTITKLIPLSNKVESLPLVGSVVQLMITILSEVISFVTTELSLVPTRLREILNQLGL